MIKDCESLQLKKLTLIAWTKILLADGKIDISKYTKMVRQIEQLKA